MSIQRRHFSLGLPSLLLATAGARAQGAAEYPNRPVRILMPSPAGAPSDITLRIVANALSQRWSHPVVVENRAGGAGRIAYEAAARSAPDGYTLVQTASNLTTLPFLHANLTFDPERDLVPVTQLITNVAVLVAQPSMGVKTLPEFVNWSKANKGKVNYGSPGVGNIVHMTIEMINASAGTDMVHVPFPSVRSRLDHPVIDADGHWIELHPVYFEYVRQFLSAKETETFRRDFGDRFAKWYRTAPQERQRTRLRRPTYWGLPTRVRDRAAGTIPALYKERLDEWGIDITSMFVLACLHGQRQLF